MIGSLLLSVQSLLGTSLRVYPERKGSTSLRSFVSMRWGSLHCSHALPKHFRMLLACEITSEKNIQGLVYCSLLFQENMARHIFIVTEGINSFPLVAIIFVGFVILRSLMGGGGGVHFPQKASRVKKLIDLLKEGQIECKIIIMKNVAIHPSIVFYKLQFKDVSQLGK